MISFFAFSFFCLRPLPTGSVSRDVLLSSFYLFFVLFGRAVRQAGLTRGNASRMAGWGCVRHKRQTCGAVC